MHCHNSAGSDEAVVNQKLLVTGKSTPKSQNLTLVGFTVQNLSSWIEGLPSDGVDIFRLISQNASSQNGIGFRHSKLT